MSRCFGCASKFGLFKREHGCGNCKKAFCSGCLGYTAIPASQSTEQQVCKACYKILTRKDQAKDVLEKRNGTVQLPENPPPYPGPTLQHQAVISQSQDDPDVKIRERLAKLKETNDSDRESHTDASVTEKFANLTGRLPGSAQKSDILTPRPKLSEQEEIDRLMEQANAEADIDTNAGEDSKTKKNTNEDIEKRLLLLKGIDPEKVKEPTREYDSSEDEEEETAKILKKALAEAAIDEKIADEGYGHLIGGTEEQDDSKLKLPSVPKTAVGASKPYFAHDDDDDEELPWCCICNADATLRCHGCDDDLYCKRCYKEGHSKFDMEDHKTSHFRPRKKR